MRTPPLVKNGPLRCTNVKEWALSNGDGEKWHRLPSVHLRKCCEEMDSTQGKQWNLIEFLTHSIFMYDVCQFDISFNISIFST